MEPDSIGVVLDDVTTPAPQCAYVTIRLGEDVLIAAKQTGPQTVHLVKDVEGPARDGTTLSRLVTRNRLAKLRPQYVLANVYLLRPSKPVHKPSTWLKMSNGLQHRMALRTWVWDS